MTSAWLPFTNPTCVVCFQVHQGNCPFEIVWCENKCGARLQRRYLSNHMRNECHKRTQPCQHCGKEFVYETLQVKWNSAPKLNFGLSVLCVEYCTARPGSSVGGATGGWLGGGPSLVMMMPLIPFGHLGLVKPKHGVKGPSVL